MTAFWEVSGKNHLSAKEKNMVYNVELSANSCTCKLIVNGLGVETLNAEKVGSIQYPCNAELIGQNNNIGVEVMPVALDMATLGKVTVEGVVKKYHPGEFSGPDAGDVLTTFSLTRTIEEIKANPLAANPADLVPFKLTAEFSSEAVPSFAGRLIEAEPIENKDALLSWAMQFRLLLEQRDIKGLYELYEPKLHDYDIAFPEEKEPDNRKWFSEWMQETVFPRKPITSFSREDIELTRWCDGRIWEISRKKGEPLWGTEGLNNMVSEVEIYVGMVDGKIKIVR